MRELAYIGAGGFIGTLTRYAIQLAMPAANTGFPWAVLLINVAGCLFLGWFLPSLYLKNHSEASLGHRHRIYWSVHYVLHIYTGYRSVIRGWRMD